MHRGAYNLKENILNTQIIVLALCNVYKSKHTTTKINVSKCFKPALFDGCDEEVFDNNNDGTFSFSGSSNAYKHTKLSIIKPSYLLFFLYIQKLTCENLGQRNSFA